VQNGIASPASAGRARDERAAATHGWSGVWPANLDPNLRSTVVLGNLCAPRSRVNHDAQEQARSPECQIYWHRTPNVRDQTRGRI